MTNSATTTPTGEPLAAPSTNAAAGAPAARRVPLVHIGDTVMVCLDRGVQRPMIVTGKELHQPAAHHDPELRLNGTIFCEPSDHTLPAFRALDALTDPARIHGRPDKIHPTAYGEMLAAGGKIGQWTTRPTNLPAGS